MHAYCSQRRALITINIRSDSSFNETVTLTNEITIEVPPHLSYDDATQMNMKSKRQLRYWIEATIDLQPDHKSILFYKVQTDRKMATSTLHPPLWREDIIPYYDKHNTNAEFITSFYRIYSWLLEANFLRSVLFQSSGD